MPVRATKRGVERTPLSGDCDVLDLRRELRRAGGRARAARQRRARAHGRPLRGRRAPDVRVRRADGVAREPRARRRRSARRSATSSSTRPRATFRWQLPFTFSTFDYRDAVRAAARRSGDARRSRPRRSTARAGSTRPHRPRRPARAARSSTRSAGGACCRAPSPRSSRPRRGCRAGWRSTRTAAATTSSCGSTPRYVRAGYSGASRPATSCASASARSTRATTSRSRRCASPATVGVPAVRYQGNWIPHQMRRADRGRRLLRRRLAPATACRRPPRASAPRCTSAWPAGASCARVVEGRQDREQALARYARVLRRATPAVPLAAARAEPRLAREPDAR